MTSRNGPRGRGDDRRPRTTSAKDVFLASVDRYGAITVELPRRQQTNAFLVGAQVLDRMAECVEERVIAGQRHRRNEE